MNKVRILLKAIMRHVDGLENSDKKADIRFFVKAALIAVDKEMSLRQPKRIEK